MEFGKLTDESPVGQGLLGKKVGVKVKITAPPGVLKFNLTEIS